MSLTVWTWPKLVHRRHDAARCVTVLLTHSQVTYAGNGATTGFPTTFSFTEQADLLVEQRTGAGAWATKVLGVDYNVSGNGLVEPGGQIDMVVAPPNNDSLRITRNTPATQPVEFGTFTRFTGRTHELAMDHRTRAIQDALRRIGVLEAGGTPASLTASQVTDTFNALEPIESTFPRVVACAGTPTVVLLGRIENLTTPAEVLPAEGLRWGTPALNSFTVEHIEGLNPGQQYRARYVVLTA